MFWTEKIGNHHERETTCIAVVEMEWRMGNGGSDAVKSVGIWALGWGSAVNSFFSS